MKSRIACIGSATQDIFVKTPEFQFRRSKTRKEIDLCLKLGKKFDIEEIHFDFGGGALNTSMGFKKRVLTQIQLFLWELTQLQKKLKCC